MPLCVSTSLTFRDTKCNFHTFYTKDAPNLWYKMPRDLEIVTDIFYHQKGNITRKCVMGHYYLRITPVGILSEGNSMTSFPRAANNGTFMIYLRYLSVTNRVNRSGVIQCFWSAYLRCIFFGIQVNGLME